MAGMKRKVQATWMFGLPVLIAAGMAAGATGCAAPGPLARQQAGYPRDKVDAPGLFLENCATCHGPDGRARTFHGRLFGAQNFTDPKWKADTLTGEIIHAIQTGPAAMPAFTNQLSASEIGALAAYVQKFPAAH